jgi:hypothetical protein
MEQSIDIPDWMRSHERSIPIYCPHCGTNSSVDHVLTPSRVPAAVVAGMPEDMNSPEDVWWIGRCATCAGVMLVHNQGDLVFPRPRPRPTPESVIAPVRAVFDEARVCLAAGAHNAAVLMSRRALELACKHFGATSGNLLQKIDSVAEQGVLPTRLRDAAHDVRTIGNEGAHGDGSIDADVAAETVELVDALLVVMFVADFRAGRLRRVRERERERDSQ